MKPGVAGMMVGVASGLWVPWMCGGCGSRAGPPGPPPRRLLLGQELHRWRLHQLPAAHQWSPGCQAEGRVSDKDGEKEESGTPAPAWLVRALAPHAEPPRQQVVAMGVGGPSVTGAGRGVQHFSYMCSGALLLIITLLPAASDAVVTMGNPDAKRLYDDLLSNYNKLVRPVENTSDHLTVRIKLKLSQLIDVVSEKKYFITGCWLSETRVVRREIMELGCPVIFSDQQEIYAAYKLKIIGTINHPGAKAIAPFFDRWDFLNIMPTLDLK